MTGEIIPFPDRNEMNRRIYHYRRAGDEFEEIAEKLEMPIAEVYKGYRDHLKMMVTEQSLTEREFIIAEELDQLRQLQIPFYNSGVEGEKEGAEVYLKIAAHRAKLLRLDQPTAEELKGKTQVIVVTGNKEEFEAALREGQRRQVAGRAQENGDEEEDG